MFNKDLDRDTRSCLPYTLIEEDLITPKELHKLMAETYKVVEGQKVVTETHIVSEDHKVVAETYKDLLYEDLFFEDRELDINPDDQIVDLYDFIESEKAFDLFVEEHVFDISHDFIDQKTGCVKIIIP